MTTPLQANDFSAFFRELWGESCDAFPWQKEFARRACSGEWPKYVAIPTGSGKTACLDASVFALAFQAGLPATERTIGRRIFFIVNRRIIVDEAYKRAGDLCQKLFDAPPDSIVGRVSAALRSLGGEDSFAPLTRTQLRGGIYRDRSWVGSLHQPMIVCSTVDQVGSRLLFRGYGVSEQARPIHAALVAQDSTLIVDEAHISRPFTQTLDWVAKYRRHSTSNSASVQLPFQVVQMTATLPEKTPAVEQIILSSADYEHPILEARLNRSKPARLLIEEKAKGKTRETVLAKRLASEATALLAEHHPRSLVVMVNRVATARMVEAELKKIPGAITSLLIGRLRPLDRDILTKRIQQRLKTGMPTETEGESPTVEIVVSTQCLEVGADLDFDSLVTEAASLDALRQRFGRLNRGGRNISPQAVIILPGDQNIPANKLSELDNREPCDLIYGNAIPHTWAWLQSIAVDGAVDFGITAMTAHLDSFRELRSEEEFLQLLSPAPQAPVLLPAYLDCWVQTNPTPAADPDVAIFLHGPHRQMAELQVCWRADLPEVCDGQWSDILSLCPPTSAESLPVPLHTFRTWLIAQQKFVDLSSDTEEQAEAPERGALEQPVPIPAFIWDGPESSLPARKLSDFKPGQTIVLRAQNGGWSALGILPEAPQDPILASEVKPDHAQLRLVDVAERAAADARRRAILRVHHDLLPSPVSGSVAEKLLKFAYDSQNELNDGDIRDLLQRLLLDESSGWDFHPDEKRILEHLASPEKSGRLTIDRYPRDLGIVVAGRRLLPPSDQQDFEQTEIEPEALLEAREPQQLSDHTRDVLSRVQKTLSLLPIDTYRDALTTAASLHDWGKADWRFQGMLRSSSEFAAMASGVLLAKSGNLTSSLSAYREACTRANLPKGFRHEMLSLQMAQTEIGGALLPKDDALRSLTLHLIATHHGFARPFAPVVTDNFPPEVRLQLDEAEVIVSNEQRSDMPAHAIDSGIAERFWQSTRLHGWWGLAFLEAVLRLSDQQASAYTQKTSRQ